MVVGGVVGVVVRGVVGVVVGGVVGGGMEEKEM